MPLPHTIDATRITEDMIVFQANKKPSGRYRTSYSSSLKAALQSRIFRTASPSGLSRPDEDNSRDRCPVTLNRPTVIPRRWLDLCDEDAAR